jgi:dinuclear metal center YbgI/SA1388 family protein
VRIRIEESESLACRVSDVTKLLDKFAPPYLAAEDDRVGLQLGDPENEVAKILITLDVLPEVVEEARAQGASLIVSHHPLIRAEVPDLVPTEPAGRVLLLAARAGISIFVAHTNLDKTKGGVSDVLAAELGLTDTEVLLPEAEANTYKLAVFVPEEAVANVIEAMSRAGAGIIGNYSHCTFRSPGIGTFKPEQGAKPAVGRVAELNEVKEYRLETVVEGERLGDIIAAMIKAHPYEEVVYDLYQRKNPSVGFGRIGNLQKELTLEDCINRWKEELGVKSSRVAGDLERKIKRVAVCGGSGGELIVPAKRKGADVFLTGDIKYHQAQLGKEIDLALVDFGHFYTERVILPRIASLIKGAGLGLEVTISEKVTDPLENI